MLHVVLHFVTVVKVDQLVKLMPRRARHVDASERATIREHQVE